MVRIILTPSITSQPARSNRSIPNPNHDPVRVGGPSNPLLADAALTTVIAGPRGDALPSSLGLWQNRASNPERSLILAFKTIATMSESILITSVLKACAARLDLGLGRRIHASLIQSTLHSDPFIAASLITLYSKCGSIADAHKVFDQLSHRDPTVWNAILAAHFHRRPIHALSLLRRMHLTGVRPDAHSLSLVRVGIPSQ